MKLYWRYKKNGKWTWRPANVTYSNKELNYYEVKEEE